MTRFDVLDNLVENGNGYLCTSQVIDAGVSKPTLAEYVSQRKMERVAQGVYLAEDAWPDELYLLCLSNSRIVFSHETALMLHGLMEREPKITSVTVKAGYNASHLRRKGIRVYQVKPDVYDLGIMEVQTSFGNTVRAYDMDRTICDILRYKDAMDVQVFQYAMKEYMGSAHKNLNHLMAYAKRFQIESAVRTYTEVLL
ncbi:MAG: abortive phage infection protein [Oscillospiraceae bacterium]|nr:abortive phage infection protein [Oscillospiraceae bacterium]MBR0391707.1 abortive phage infection protein [Oscillospiraceae bacterium]